MAQRYKNVDFSSFLIYTKSRPDYNFILQPSGNLLRVLDADYKVGRRSAIDKHHPNNLIVGLVGGSHKLPFVPMGILVNKRNIEVIVVAMMARVDVNIEIGKTLVDHEKLSPSGVTIRYQPVGFGTHTAVNIELCEAGDRHHRENEYEKHPFHAAKITKK